MLNYIGIGSFIMYLKHFSWQHSQSLRKILIVKSDEKKFKQSLANAKTRNKCFGSK